MKIRYVLPRIQGDNCIWLYVR